MTGSVLPDPNCVPASTFDTPIPSISECPDLNPNDSISVRYYFPRQAHPHRSILLRGYRSEPARLTESDKDWVRRGGQGGRRGHRHGGGGNGNVTGGPGMARGRYESGPPRTNGYQQPPPRSNYGGGSGYGYGAPAPLPSRPPISSYGGGAGGYGYGNPYAAAPDPYAGGYGAPAPYGELDLLYIHSEDNKRGLTMSQPQEAMVSVLTHHRCLHPAHTLPHRRLMADLLREDMVMVLLRLKAAVTILIPPGGRCIDPCKR